MSRFGDSFMKKGTTFRRSLRFGSKKETEKTSKPEIHLTTSEGLEEKMEVEVEEVKEELEEMEEMYKLPDIPHTPLSGMDLSACL